LSFELFKKNVASLSSLQRVGNSVGEEVGPFEEAFVGAVLDVVVG